MYILYYTSKKVNLTTMSIIKNAIQTAPKAGKKPKADLQDRKRTLSRLMAIQTFYQYDFFGKEKDIEELKNSLIDNYAMDVEEEIKSYREKVDNALIQSLILGLKKDLENIDSEITFLFKKENDVKNSSDILLQIMRFAAFELKHSKDVPLKVIIDEYVDIAAHFVSVQKVTFVNGSLENLAKKYREEEFATIKNKKA